MSSSVMVPGQATSHSRRSLRWLIAGVVLAVASTIALSAWAQQRPGPHGGMEGPGIMMFGGHGRGLDRMLDSINATDAQCTQVKQIAQQAAADLKAQHETTRALREKAAQIFTAPTVDAAAAESVRQQLVTQHDAASRRMLQAMLDISRVLTPEQRAKVGELMKQRQQRMLERMQQHHDQQQPPKQ